MLFRFTGWRRYRACVIQNRAPVRTLISASVISRVPPSSALREAPTPLVFVTNSALDGESTKEITTLSSMLAEKGFSCLQVDLSPSTTDPDTPCTPAGLLQGYSEELRSIIRLSGNPFPPVVVARSASCLVSQKYISSYPATGLVLISPPKNNADTEKTRLEAPLDEFIYEPKFPIAVIDTPRNIGQLKGHHRLCKEPNVFVDVITVDKLEGQPLLNAVDLWLDQLGI